MRMSFSELKRIANYIFVECFVFLCFKTTIVFIYNYRKLVRIDGIY